MSCPEKNYLHFWPRYQTILDQEDKWQPIKDVHVGRYGYHVTTRYLDDIHGSHVLAPRYKKGSGRYNIRDVGDIQPGSFSEGMLPGDKEIQICSMIMGLQARVSHEFKPLVVTALRGLKEELGLELDTHNDSGKIKIYPFTYDDAASLMVTISATQTKPVTDKVLMSEFDSVHPIKCGPRSKAFFIIYGSEEECLATRPNFSKVDPDLDSDIDGIVCLSKKVIKLTGPDGYYSVSNEHKLNAVDRITTAATIVIDGTSDIAEATTTLVKTIDTSPTSTSTSTPTHTLVSRTKSKEKDKRKHNQGGSTFCFKKSPGSRAGTKNWRDK